MARLIAPLDHIGLDRIGFDQRLDTDRPIQGTLVASASLGASPDLSPDDRDGTRRPPIRIQWRAAVAVPPDEAPVWTRVGDALWFAPPGVARYRCTAASIDVIPLKPIAHAAIDALLVATALPAMLWLQGAFMLHASAIVPHDHDGALAIAGASGSGKSRLAAAFLANRAQFVADDSIAVRWDDDKFAVRWTDERSNAGPRCAGLAGGYHLGPHDADDLNVRDVHDARAFHPVPDHRARRSAPLATIVILDDDPRASRKRLVAIEAVAALLANRHRAGALRRHGLEPRALRDAARIVRSVPVYRWPRKDADALLDDDVRRTIM